MERCRECEEEALRYYSSVGICPAENEIEEYLLYFECNHSHNIRMTDRQIQQGRPVLIQEGVLRSVQ
jgi:hypothetical protein